MRLCLQCGKRRENTLESSVPKRRGREGGRRWQFRVVGYFANAVFDATGLRLRSIPYTPTKVKAAMGSA